MAALPVGEKVRLLTGADSWRTYGAPALGLRPIVMSDGPAGIRGVTKDDRNPSASVPCPSALGATWDSELVRELAAALGAEARGKGIDIVLAPTMNLMRTPLGGRGFECFSEDPVLSARLAASYVTGLQSAGVGAAIKHFVGNDSETERWTYDARIAEAVLRELYLVPFEASVREAGAVMVMAAYNAVNGARMTEHERLLRGVLKGEWGFTGAIVSDWDACRSVVPTALAGLDLAMPGPDSPWVTGLADAVRSGQVPEEVLDEQVLRLLEVARRVGALSPPDGQHRTASHRTASRHPAGPGRPGAAAPRRSSLVRAAPQRAGRTAARPGQHRQHRADRAERRAPGHPGRRQRGRPPGGHLRPGRGAARGPGRPGHGDRHAGLSHLGDRAGATGPVADRPGHR